jgi:hypothetical protein
MLPSSSEKFFTRANAQSVAEEAISPRALQLCDAREKLR